MLSPKDNRLANQTAMRSPRRSGSRSYHLLPVVCRNTGSCPQENAYAAVWEWNGGGQGSVPLSHYAFWRKPVAKPLDPREHEQKSKKKPGGQQHQNPPRKTDTDNPERNPRDQKGRGGSK